VQAVETRMSFYCVGFAFKLKEGYLSSPLLPKGRRRLNSWFALEVK